VIKSSDSSTDLANELDLSRFACRRIKLLGREISWSRKAL
jgi:hypothetical protein